MQNLNFLPRLIYVLVLFILNSCSVNENNNIPLVLVNFQININDPANLNLQTVGGSIETFGGSRGIILFRASEDEILAYDRHCTFQPSNTCALVSVDASGFTASDNCCGSTFLLSNGSVTNPPANVPLKSYPTTFDGTFVYVSN